jgi:hypothetical protein
VLLFALRRQGENNIQVDLYKGPRGGQVEQLMPVILVTQMAELESQFKANWGKKFSKPYLNQ